MRSEDWWLSSVLCPMVSENGMPACLPKRVKEPFQNEIIFAGFFMILDEMLSVCNTNSVWHLEVSTNFILKIAEGQSGIKVSIISVVFKMDFPFRFKTFFRK